MIDVIIVAAGKGTRLQPYTFEKPKALVPIKGKPLIQHQIDAFKGIDCNFIIVAGYMHEKVKEYIKSKGIDATIVTNLDYNDTGCGYSMIEGLKVSKNDVICVIGDVLFTHSNVKLLAKDKNNCMLVRKTNPSMLGQKVSIKDKFISHISLGGYASYDAEAVGPFKLKHEDVEKLIEKYDAMNKDNKDNIHCYSLLGIYISNFNVIPLYIDDNEWMEIDTLNDWEVANRFWSY